MPNDKIPLLVQPMKVQLPRDSFGESPHLASESIGTRSKVVPTRIHRSTTMAPWEGSSIDESTLDIHSESEKRS